MDGACASLRPIRGRGSSSKSLRRRLLARRRSRHCAALPFRGRSRWRAARPIGGWRLLSPGGGMGGSSLTKLWLLAINQCSGRGRDEAGGKKMRVEGWWVVGLRWRWADTTTKPLSLSLVLSNFCPPVSPRWNVHCSAGAAGAAVMPAAAGGGGSGGGWGAMAGAACILHAVSMSVAGPSTNKLPTCRRQACPRSSQLFLASALPAAPFLANRLPPPLTSTQKP